MIMNVLGSFTAHVHTNPHTLAQKFTGAHMHTSTSLSIHTHTLTPSVAYALTLVSISQ